MASWRNWLVAPSVVLCIGAIAACGSSSKPSTAATATSTSPSSGSPASTATTDSAVAAKVPASIKSKGTLTVAADASYAPDEFIGPDGHTVIGMDADLSHAIAETMGLKANVVNATFATIIPGLASGRYDMGASSFTDTRAREKTVDFVDYANVGESFYTKTNGGTQIGSIADICGKTVSVESGTTELADSHTQSEKCTKEGKPPVKVLTFSTQTEANLAVSSGRAELGFADTPVAGYQVKQSGGLFKLVGATYAPAPYGLALPKQPGLAPAVLAALRRLDADGIYAKIFAHWGLQGIEIQGSHITINGATS